jgi:long-chain fatty acid transport protein
MWLTACLCPESLGAGFQLYTEGSAEALGLGGAISARRDMISNAWYNPASVADTETPRFMLGNTSLKLAITYSDPTYEADLVDNWRYCPHAYYIQPLTDTLTASIAFNAPYGMVTHWRNGWKGRETAIDTDMCAFYLTPALSWRATDKLSLAVGANVVRAEADIRKGLPAIWSVNPLNGQPFEVAPPNEMTVHGDDYGLGYLLAANYQINEAWTVGAKFQSRVDLKFKGDARYHSRFSLPPAGLLWTQNNAEADLRIPANLTLGVANRTFDRWTLTFDAVWTEWSTYDSLDFRFDKSPVPGKAGTPGTVRNPKGWSDVWSYRFGAEYQLNENWVLRGGYVFDESAENDKTRAPEMPDSDRHMFCLGAGYTRDHWGIDVAYCYLMAKKTDVGTDTVPPLDPNGEYETDVHMVSVSLRYAF